MIGLLVTGSHNFASGTAPEAPHRRFWQRVFDWLLGR
jgi:hypothetical protein